MRMSLVAGTRRRSRAARAAGAWSPPAPAPVRRRREAGRLAIPRRGTGRRHAGGGPPECNVAVHLRRAARDLATPMHRRRAAAGGNARPPPPAVCPRPDAWRHREKGPMAAGSSPALSGRAQADRSADASYWATVRRCLGDVRDAAPPEGAAPQTPPAGPRTIPVIIRARSRAGREGMMREGMRVGRSFWKDVGAGPNPTICFQAGRG